MLDRCFQPLPITISRHINRKQKGDALTYLIVALPMFCRMPQDMGFGTECGFQKLLMLSGGTPKDALLAQTDPNQLPNYYADSFADFIELYNETMHVEE